MPENGGASGGGGGETGNANVDVFHRDAMSNEGYLYTATDRLSSRMATTRSLDTIMAMGRFEGRRVLDVGCGDGHFTKQIFDRGRPSEMSGIDGAAGAIEVANRTKGDRPIRFDVSDAHHVPYPDDSFDLVLVQSILHHDERPKEMIREAFRLGREILIHEPNGNNMGLKVIEKTSRYHIEHQEKSYYSWQIRRWIEECGGRVTGMKFAGFVPMFAPDWLARAMKAVEPVVESVPGLNAFGASVQVFTAERKG